MIYNQDPTFKQMAPSSTGDSRLQCCLCYYCKKIFGYNIALLQLATWNFVKMGGYNVLMNFISSALSTFASDKAKCIEKQLLISDELLARKRQQSWGAFHYFRVLFDSLLLILSLLNPVQQQSRYVINNAIKAWPAVAPICPFPIPALSSAAAMKFVLHHIAPRCK